MEQLQDGLEMAAAVLLFLLAMTVFLSLRRSDLAEAISIYDNLYEWRGIRAALTGAIRMTG